MPQNSSRICVCGVKVGKTAECALDSPLCFTSDLNGVKLFLYHVNKNAQLYSGVYIVQPTVY